MIIMSSCDQNNLSPKRLEDVNEDQEMSIQDNWFSKWLEGVNEKERMKRDAEAAVQLTMANTINRDSGNSICRVTEEVPKFSWEWAPDEEDIDQAKTVDEEIATHDKYGKWIPSPADFKWNLKESAPVATGISHLEMANSNVSKLNISHQKPTTNNEDKFSTWWALTRKDYWDMLPVCYIDPNRHMLYVADTG